MNNKGQFESIINNAATDSGEIVYFFRGGQ